jgi:hypothetical protein
MERFTTTDITKGLKIPFGRLREWIIRGYAMPSFPSAGQGQAAEFTIEDIYKIKTFQHMIDGGLTRETAGIYVKSIGDLDIAPWNYYALLFTRAKNRVKVIRIEASAGFLAGMGGQISLNLQNADKRDEDWDDIYLLNIKKITGAVDKAFGR